MLDPRDPQPHRDIHTHGQPFAGRPGERLDEPYVHPHAEPLGHPRAEPLGHARAEPLGAHAQPLGHAHAAGAPSRRPRGNPLHDPRLRGPLMGIGAGVLALMLLLAFHFGRGTNQATRELQSANERVLEKRQAVEEARQILELRLAELREAQAAVAVDAERLDVEMVRERGDRQTETEAGEVEALPPAVPVDAETRAQESLRRSDGVLRGQPYAQPAPGAGQGYPQGAPYPPAGTYRRP